MAESPAFASDPNVGLGSLSVANTARDGTGTIVTVFTASNRGAKIEEIVVKATGDVADCTIVFYIFDGTNYFVFDEWDVGDPAAGSATVASFREARVYDNLILDGSHSLRASITVAPTTGTVKVLAFGANY